MRADSKIATKTDQPKTTPVKNHSACSVSRWAMIALSAVGVVIVLIFLFSSKAVDLGVFVHHTNKVSNTLSSKLMAMLPFLFSGYFAYKKSLDFSLIILGFGWIQILV